METENQLPQRTLTLIALITLTLADLFFSAQSPPPLPSPRASPHRICICICVGRRRRRRRRKEVVLHLRESTHTYIHTVHTYSKYSTVQVVFTCRCLLVVVCIAALPVKEFILLRGLKFSVRGQEQEKCRDPSS